MEFFKIQCGVHNLWWREASFSRILLVLVTVPHPADPIAAGRDYEQSVMRVYRKQPSDNSFKMSFSRYKALFLTLAVTLVVMLLASALLFRDSILSKMNCPYVWHGGSPTDSHKGSCWCGSDEYCLCTPSLAIDCIIEYDGGIVLVRRRDPPADKFAIPGGFVSVGESAEDATIREVKEETNLTLSSLEQFRFYSDPKRDARRHTVSMVYKGKVNTIEGMHTGDDAKGVTIVPMAEILALNLAFDHKIIFQDYFRQYHPPFMHPDQPIDN